MIRTPVLVSFEDTKRPRAALTAGAVADTYVGGIDMSDSTRTAPWTDSAGRHFFDRFWAKVDADGDCWEWTAALDDKGYADFKLDGWQQKAYRVAYEHLVGPIADGLHIDHLCRNPRCVNPDHLEPVTPGENTRRGYGRAARNARKTHCKRGHEFTPDNTIQHPRGRGCRQCQNQRRAARRQQPVVVSDAG